MDSALAMVQAYLRVNGYFTVSEYPVAEAVGDGGHRSLTDIDVLAFRFPGAGRAMKGSRPGTVDPERHEPDAYLGRPGELPDMLVGEVKEGRAWLNRSARNPAVLRAALARFGCCSPDEAPRIVTDLVRTGRTATEAGHQIRLVVFGSRHAESSGRDGFTFIPLGHVIEFLEAHIREHWELVRHVQTKDPALGFLLTLAKARRGRPRSSPTTTGGET